MSARSKHRYALGDVYFRYEYLSMFLCIFVVYMFLVNLVFLGYREFVCVCARARLLACVEAVSVSCSGELCTELAAEFSD